MGYRVTEADEQAARVAFGLFPDIGAVAEVFAKHRFDQSATAKYGLEYFEVGWVQDYPRSGEHYRSGQCKTQNRLIAAARKLHKRMGWTFATEVVGNVVRVRRVK